MLEIIEDTLIDGIKLLPFLFITYLIMEYIEHKTSEKAKNILGWRPEYTDMEAIISSAWKWHKSHPQGFKTCK